MNDRKLTLIFLGIFLLINPSVGLSQATGPTTYYISSSGSDSNNGTSTSTPWKTINKINQRTFKPGDHILFKRGEKFYGGLIISQSGKAGNAITFGSYGTGALPMISGFTSVSSWVNLGNNMWESTSPVSTLSTVHMVVVNGVEQPMGRWPNTEYRTITSHVTNTSITDSTLSGSPNWTGGEVVIRKWHWILDRNIITSHSGGTITYTSASANNANNGYGYFIQNHAKTLDVQNEWYYNRSTKKLQIYSTSKPTNVQVSSVEDLVYLVYQDYITFDGISFQGANTNALYIGSSRNITVQNSSIDFSGQNAVWGGKNLGKPSSNFLLQHTSINHTNNNAIILADDFSNAVIRGNSIQNTGMIAGMGQVDGRGYTALETYRNAGLLVEKNRINQVGFIGIHFDGNNTIIRNNLIANFCSVKDDGGGIYSWQTKYTNQKILNNIILNGKGAPAGTADKQKSAEGIYLDDNTSNVEVAGNTVAHTAYGGLYMHNTHKNNIHDNTFYNNGVGQIFLDSDDSNVITSSNLINNNIFFSHGARQYTGRFNAQHGPTTFASFGSFNNNYYVRPMDDNSTIRTVINNGITSTMNTLAQWKSMSRQDANSKKSPKVLTDSDDLRFEYNASDIAKTVTLDTAYIDVKNKSYSGKVTIAPWSSVVLIKANNIPPPRDTTLPSIKISNPISGTVTGKINFAATASDSAGVSKVDFYQNGKLLAADTASPYSVAWNTASVPNGNYTLTAVATDKTGNARGVIVSVKVNNNASDPVPPTIKITNPLPGTITGKINFTATATDNTAVSKVDFYQNGKLIAADSISPYTVSWNTTSVPNGKCTLTAVATDKVGNAKGVTVLITVNNR